MAMCLPSRFLAASITRQAIAKQSAERASIHSLRQYQDRRSANTGGQNARPDASVHGAAITLFV